MSIQVQLRRGNTAQHTAFTGAVAEITVDTDKKVVVVHDGSTAGGVPLAKQSSLDVVFGVANAAFNTANSGGGGGSTDLTPVFVVANGGYTVANAAFGVVNAAYTQSNSEVTRLSAAYVVANAAFDKANTGGGGGMDYAYVNTSTTAANNYAGSLVNSAAAIAVGAFDAANSKVSMDYVYVNTSSTAANNYAGVMANAANAYAASLTPDLSPAFNKANGAYTVANAAFDAANAKYSASGGTISGNVNITGDLNVHGNTYFTDQSTLRISDPLIYLAGNNYISDVVDIGFVANYVNTGGANVHTGLYRTASTKEYYLFQGYDKEPYDNYIDPAGNNFTKAVLNADIRTSNLNLGGANAIVWIKSSYDNSNAAFDKANSANVLAYNTGTGANAYASSVGVSANAYASSVGTSTNNYTSATYSTLTQFGSVFGVANAAYGQANTLATSANAYAATVGTSSNNYIGSLANTGFALQSMSVSSLSDSSGTIAWDASTSRMATVTLSGTGRTVSNPTNLKAGTYVLVVKQDATGSRTITTWGNAFKWPAAVAPTLSTTASTTDLFTFWCDGTNLYGSSIPDCR